MRPKVNDLKKIRVGAVSYLNTKPLLYGIKQHDVIGQMELIEDYPANIARMLLEDQIDMGLVPMAILPLLKESHMVSDYCIGADGPVASVCLFSDVPMEEVTAVHLDYQSRTSVMLAKILLKEYWRSDAELIIATAEDYRSKIKGTVAGLVIGDRAFEQRLQSRCSYDLAEAWKEHTALPFVFAAWVSNKPLPEDFLAQFNSANALGLDSLTEVVAANKIAHFDLRHYYTACISYHLTEDKRKGLALFLDKVAQYQLKG